MSTECKPQGESQVPEQIVLLEKGQDRLTQVLDLLQERLVSVLQEPSPSNASPSDEGPTIVLMASRLRIVGQRLNGNADFVQNLIDRLEI